MQTFLPYKNLIKSVTCLDYRRLGKQRVEAYGIIGLLSDFTLTPTLSDKAKLYLSKRYKNHPAVKLWTDNIKELIAYYNLCVITWKNRGYKNNMPFIAPNWNIKSLSFSPALYSSHRSNLLRKDYNFYSQYKWPEMKLDYKNIKYVWH